MQTSAAFSKRGIEICNSLFNLREVNGCSYGKVFEEVNDGCSCVYDLIVKCFATFCNFVRKNGLCIKYLCTDIKGLIDIAVNVDVIKSIARLVRCFTRFLFLAINKIANVGICNSISKVFKND